MFRYCLMVTNIHDNCGIGFTSVWGFIILDCRILLIHGFWMVDSLITSGSDLLRNYILFIWQYGFAEMKCIVASFKRNCSDFFGQNNINLQLKPVKFTEITLATALCFTHDRLMRFVFRRQCPYMLTWLYREDASHHTHSKRPLLKINRPIQVTICPAFTTSPASYYCG